jgi:uncharacterized protein YggT (Ycf19 family)
MSTLAIILEILLRGIQLLIFARVILAFFPIDRKSAFVSVPYAFTEPVIMPARSLLFLIRPLKRIPFDISPIVVFLLLELLIALI